MMYEVKSDEVKFNILYVTSVDVSLGNGPGVNEREFIIQLSKLNNIETNYILPKTKLQLLDDDFPFKKCIWSFRWSRGDVLRFLPHTISQIIHYFMSYVSIKPDLVVYRLTALPISIFICTLILRPKYVVKTTGPNLLETFYGKNTFLYFLNREIMKFLIRNACSCDAVSVNHVEKLRRLFPRKEFFVCDNAVNTTRFYPLEKIATKRQLSIDNFDYVVGYAGNFPYTRGARQLIEISKTLISKFPKIGFIILGDNGDVSYMRKIVDDQGLGNYFIFTGTVLFSEVNKWINTFDIGVSFLSLEQSGASEQKVRQYLACGVPVVCSRGSSNFIEIERLGFVVDYDNLSDIESKITSLLKLDRDSMSSLSYNCRQYAENNLSIQRSINLRLEYWVKWVNRN